MSRLSIFFEVPPKTMRSVRPGPRHDRPATAAPPSTNSNSSRAIVTGMWQDAPAGYGARKTHGGAGEQYARLAYLARRPAPTDWRRCCRLVFLAETRPVSRAFR